MNTLKRTARGIWVMIMMSTMGVWMASCGKEYRTNEGMIWHTSYHITYSSDRDMGDSIMATLRGVDRSLNVFDGTSLVSRANDGDSVEVDGHYIRVYEKSREIHRMSGGAFDPTLGPLITAWGFGKGHKATSDTLRIDSLMQIVGIAKTRLEGNRLVKGDRRIEFNYSAIAKGYGCDCVAEMLERNGISDYMVEIGGEIRCAGESPTGQGWRVSIDRPVRSERVDHSSQCIIEITDRGMATSGNYRNYHQEGGKIYGHTISAKTGRPTLTDVLSATVVSGSSMEADGLATAMMAMGSERAKALADSLKLPVMLILTDTVVWQTSEFERLIRN
ncbi:MAG: FAD:protein FMN transferase [Lepagella sp.]